MQRSPLVGPLVGVSCTSRRACSAVGSFFSREAVIRWDGARWTVQRTPTRWNPADVSCTSPTACVVIGTNNDSEAESWNGTRWSATELMNSNGIGDELQAVSCTSMTACMAVGQVTTDTTGDTGTEAVRLTGRRWSWQSTLDLGPGPGLSGVSCTSSTTCVAIGSTALDSRVAGPLLEQFSGARWTAQIPAAPHGETRSFLADIACVARSGCIVVGRTRAASGPVRPMVGRYF